MQYTLIDNNDNSKYIPYLSMDMMSRYMGSEVLFIVVAVDDDRDGAIAGVGAFVSGKVTDIKEINIVDGYDYIEVYSNLVDTIFDIVKDSPVKVCTISVYEDQDDELTSATVDMLEKKGFLLDDSSDMFSANIKTISKNLAKFEDTKVDGEVVSIWSLDDRQAKDLDRVLAKNFMPLSALEGVEDETSLVYINDLGIVNGCIITSMEEDEITVEYLYMKNNNPKGVMALITTCLENAKGIYSKAAMVTAVAADESMKKMLKDIFGERISTADNYFKMISK